MKHFLHVLPCTFLIISIYFVYHGIYGHRGILRLNKLQQETALAQQVLESSNQQLTDLKTKVVAIQKGSRDLIEEELLRTLNMGNKNDLVILTK